VTPLGRRTFLFGKVYRVRDGEAELINNQAAPVAIEGTPGQSQEVDLDLVGFQRTFEAGDTLRIALSSTDGAFTTARQSAGFIVDHDASTLSVPMREADPVDDGDGDPSDGNGGPDDGDDGPTVTVEGPGNFTTGGALELVDIAVRDGPVFVRDAVPTGWIVEEADHPYTRTAPPETEKNYIRFQGKVTEGDRRYLARSPGGVGETNAYTFGPVEISEDGKNWEPVDGTERTVFLVGVET
jgi:hypothetical protein